MRYRTLNNSVKKACKAAKRNYFNDLAVELATTQEERFHFGVFTEKLKLTKSSVPSLITFNCDIKFPKGFLSL